MTEGSEAKGIPPWLTDEYAQAWMDEHVAELRQSVAGQRLLYSSLVVSFVVGLAAHIAGYALRLPVPQEPFGLLAELLYALGWSLWTGVVVVVFVQIIPEVKRRQYKQALEAYEALQREKGETSGER